MDDSQEHDFYDSLISVARKLGKKETVVIVEDFNGHVERNSEDFEDLHGGYGY